MRWLYHVVPTESRSIGTYAPPSLISEGFVHASFRDVVAGTIAEYYSAFAPGALTVLQIDPRRVGARVEVVETARGPMPHIHGPIPRDAVRAELAPGEVARAPDRVTGTRAAFVAFSGMTLLDLVGVHDALRRIAAMGFDSTFTAELISAGKTAWADAGARLEVERVRPPLDAFDLLVVPGGLGADALAEDESFIAWIASFPANRWIASVCTGALILGAAGRLRGLRATTHARALDRLADYGATPVSERVVDEGNVFTAGGVTSGIDLGLHLVRALEDEGVAARIAAQMEVRGWIA